MPYAIAGVGRSVGPFKLLGPRFQVMDVLTQWCERPPAVMVPRLRARPWMVRKLVEQMLERSGDF